MMQINQDDIHSHDVYASCKQFITYLLQMKSRIAEMNKKLRSVLKKEFLFGRNLSDKGDAE